MSRKPARPHGALAVTIVTIVAVVAGVGFFVADYVIGAASSVRKRLRAITRV